jgi:hypothetical protein
MWFTVPQFLLPTRGLVPRSEKHCLTAGGLRAVVYVLDFFPCFMGLAATATARLVRSLSQFLRSFCCLVTTGAAILLLLGLEGIHEFHAIPNLNNLPQIIKIS